MNLDKLAKYAPRFEQLLEEMDALKADWRELEAEARVEAEINVKALRKVLTAMRKKKLGKLRMEIEDTEIIADTLEWKGSKEAARKSPPEPVVSFDAETGEITEPAAEAVSAAPAAGEAPTPPIPQASPAVLTMPEIPAFLDRRQFMN